MEEHLLYKKVKNLIGKMMKFLFFFRVLILVLND